MSGISSATPLERQLRFQSTLIQLTQSGGQRTGDAALRNILHAAGQALGVERTSYWSLVDESAAIVCDQLFTLSTGAFAQGGRLEATVYPAYFDALRSSKAILADDAVNDPRTSEFAIGYFDVHGIGAMLDVPVWREGKLAGVLCHEHVGPPRAWSVEEQNFTLAVANIIALALEAAARSRAEERYRLASLATGEVIWEWDFAADRITWSDAVFTLLGHTLEGCASSGGWWLEHVEAADRDRIDSSIQRTIDSGGVAWTGHYRFHCGDGSMADIVDRGFITRDEAGRAIRMTGSMQNVTERKQLEARLLLADRMASMGTLAAGVAHEINNPLAYVQGNLEHVIEQLSKLKGIDPDLLAALEDARQGAVRVREIVRDLNTLSRGDDAVAPVDVDAVVERSIAMAWNEIRHRARLVRELGAPPAALATDARLGQVVLNLLVNAAQAIPEGDIERNMVRVRTALEADKIVIEVSDTGPGIPPQTAMRIFDPFFTTKAVGVGTGLGLSICHSIVTALGGDIVVESAPGKGALFRVTLPRATDLLEEASCSEPAPAPVKPRRRRVLVIDDEVGVRTLLKRVLERDHEVELSEGGADALARLTSGASYDAIVCDVMMPGVSGIDVHEALLVSSPALAKRMIFVSGGAFTARAREFLAETQQPFLSKPFDADELRRTVASVV